MSTPLPVIISYCIECEVEPTTHHINDVPLCDACGNPAHADERAGSPCGSSLHGAPTFSVHVDLEF